MHAKIYFFNFYIKFNSVLKFSEPLLKTLDNSADIFNALSNIPGNIYNIQELFEVNTFFLVKYIFIYYY